VLVWRITLHWISSDAGQGTARVEGGGASRITKSMRNPQQAEGSEVSCLSSINIMGEKSRGIRKGFASERRGSSQKTVDPRPPASQRRRMRRAKGRTPEEGGGLLVVLGKGRSDVRFGNGGAEGEEIEEPGNSYLKWKTEGRVLTRDLSGACMSWRRTRGKPMMGRHGERSRKKPFGLGGEQPTPGARGNGFSGLGEG